MLKFLSLALDPAEFRAGPNPLAWTQAKRILLAAAVVRLVLGAIVPLFPDETYYWEWSRELAFGYFDHPPVIALLVRAGTAVFGVSAFGVRVVPILAGAGTALAVVMMARSVGGDASARLAAILFTVMPLVAVGSVLATPDMPMLCAAAWALYAVLRGLGVPARADLEDGPADGSVALRWWALAGVATGIAMGSKYTSVLVPASVFAAFVMHGKLQNRFGQPGPYAAVVVASLIIAPVLVWNATHDWVSFRFQLAHGLGAARGGALGVLNRELELVGGQVGLVSPILFFFVVRAVRDGMRYSEEGIRLVLAMTAILPLAFFAYSASRRSVEANWPAMAWIGAVVLLASDLPHSVRMRAWLRRGIVLAAVLSAIVYVHVVVPILPLPAPRDQVAKAFGWELVAATVQRKRVAIRPGRGAPATEVAFIAAERYQDAAELAFHLPDHPRVFALNLSGRANQYDLWEQYRDVAALGSTLILVLDDQRDEPRVIRKLACCFARIDESEGVSLMRGNSVVQRKRVWILSGKTDGWPSRDQPGPPN
ncbi:MAG: glycosyltransferase family 39 protein [Gemmatimonadetes bacterium]|nr:glycosyltransferase family 39 protein [Gemmatimonadota bacterium]